MNVRQLPSPGEFVWMRVSGIGKPVRAKVVDIGPTEVLLKFDDPSYHNRDQHRSLYLAAFEAALVRGAA